MFLSHPIIRWRYLKHCSVIIQSCLLTAWHNHDQQWCDVSCVLCATETVQNTVWHRVSVFRPGLRESILQNLKKGQRVLVQGRIGYLERKDPNDETIVNKTVSIVAHDVVLFK